MALRSPDLNIMVKAAEKASKSLLRDFGEVEQLQVSKKGPADFVSAADKRAEQIIFEELKYARPDYSFLMEESGKIEGKDKDNIFIIDPLDGTMNFLNGIPHWCISIGLSRNGEIVAGLVYDPVKDEMFMAEKGQGAFMRNKRLRVSGNAKTEGAAVAGGSPIKAHSFHGAFMKELENLLSYNLLFRRMGAAALDLAYVAAGRFDAYWERGTQPWDVAAGVLLVKEAGGTVKSFNKDTPDPVYSKAILAANSNLYNTLEKIILSD